MPQQLILVRHGHTSHNKKKILQGWLDTELDELGFQQAQKLADRLASMDFDAIYSSDLKRAFQTAQTIAQKVGKQVIPTPHLRESHLGIFQGMEWQNPPEALGKLWQELLGAVKRRDLHWKKHQGESLAEIYDRLSQLFHQLKTNHPNKKIVLVTHGGTIRRFLELLNLKANNTEFIPIHNTSVSILDKTPAGSYQLTLFNDISHLD